MKILHIAAHLGGGIGKAHAAIARELPCGVEQTFLLLEEPIDRRHADAVARCGARVTVERDPGRIRALAHQADIVQLEYWGHPLLNKYAHLGFMPSVKTVCWSHISGLFPPSMPSFLAVDRLVLTSDISLPVVPRAIRNRTSVINSGFGFARHAVALRGRPGESLRSPILARSTSKNCIAEPSTPIDAFDDDMAPVSLWGHISPEVASCAAAMRHPERIKLRGHTLDPRVGARRS